MDSDVLPLPSDIIKDILKRLPVKSLIRFQCVCKEWKNLLKNPSFIADHLQQSSHQIPSFLFECNHQHWLCCFHLLDSELQVRKIHSIPRLKSARIVGSCNGLLCVEINQLIPSLLSLWNPATSAIRDLPQGIFNDLLPCETGFGFSPINDYKIVRIFAPYDDEISRAEVFSLNTGSWKGLYIDNLQKVSFNSNSNHVTANGALFWLATKRVKPKTRFLFLDRDGEGYVVNRVVEIDDDFAEEQVIKVVVSFDIVKEVFTLISMPNLDDDRDAMLTVYDNKLAIISEILVNDSPDLVDLWVFDEGACESGTPWRQIKRYTSNNDSIDLTTTWSNAIVCKPSLYKEHIEGRGNVLYLMNLTTNEFKRFVIPHCGPVNRIYNHVESIVSVWPWDGSFYYDIERKFPLAD